MSLAHAAAAAGVVQQAGEAPNEPPVREADGSRQASTGPTPTAVPEAPEENAGAVEGRGSSIARVGSERQGTHAAESQGSRGAALGSARQEWEDVGMESPGSDDVSVASEQVGG